MGEVYTDVKLQEDSLSLTLLVGWILPEFCGPT